MHPPHRILIILGIVLGCVATGATFARLASSGSFARPPVSSELRAQPQSPTFSGANAVKAFVDVQSKIAAETARLTPDQQEAVMTLRAEAQVQIRTIQQQSDKKIRDLLRSYGAKIPSEEEIARLQKSADAVMKPLLPARPATKQQMDGSGATR